MNKKEIFYLTLTLLGILTLIFTTQNQKIKIATISSIEIYPEKTLINLENKTTQLIIFKSPSLNLSKGDKIKFQGKENIYKGQKQIIISKISKM